MKTPFQSCSKPARFFGVALSFAMSLAAVGVLVMPATAFAAAQNPVVDQQPLTVQPVVPPDITLMLDDSGSMNANYMPDWDYLKNNTNNDAVIDAANNGVYYDPTVTYTPPPTADGGSYTNETDMTNVPQDGFGIITTNTVDLFTYGGSYECNHNGGCGSSKIDFNTGGSTDSYNYDKGYYDSHTGYYLTSWPNKNYNFDTQAGCDNWYNDFDTNRAYKPWYAYDHQYNASQKTCKVYYYTDSPPYFQYSTGPAAGPTYTVHYVAQTTADCADSPDPGNCVAMDDTSGKSAPSGVAVSTNVANWFAYYHTRILMAKTGLMNGFADLKPTYRFGFGSINGNNASWIDSNITTGVYKYKTSTNSDNRLAEVQPFGDGSAGTQKALFWTWVDTEKAGANTPLRGALQAAGQYYQTKQPWESMPGDPGYNSAVGATNNPLACRAAYTILTTDGFWNGSTPSNIGDVDGNVGSKVTGPNNQSFTYSPVQPYTDALLTTSITYKSVSCDDSHNYNATLDTASGACNWTGIEYRHHSYNGMSHRYGSSYSCSNAPYNGYYYCKDLAGSYGVCDNTNNATWDSSHQQCAVTTTSGSSNSDTLADVAMYYWLADLQDGTGSSYNLLNEVPTSTEDEAFWQHMTTFTMGLGFTPTGITPATTTIGQIFDWAHGGTAISNFSWPTPSSNSLNNIADLAHAAVNGHGDFFSATSPQAFTSGIQSALSRVAERVGTGASLAANSTSLTTGTVIYQANYYTSLWKGELKAYPVNSVTGAISATPTWQATSQLPAAANRTIETFNPSTGKFVPFKNGASAAPDLSAAQLTALGSTTADQEAVVDYLRGDSSKEQDNGGTYRTRSTALGDIVSSQPIYAGAPDANEFINQSFLGNIADASGAIPFYDWAVGTTDAATKVFTASAASQRTPLVFVASNDGMLHAFNASTGAEVYAYMPGAVITAGIKDLTDPNYGGSTVPHQYFNDGQATVADAYIKTASETVPSWHTILVGTTGRGLAKAVYALDITDPANITPLWERSAGDVGVTGDSPSTASDYIGQMVGKPVIAQTDYTPKSGSTAASSTWSVLIGNGYNSKNGVAALLQFDLATGALSVHTTDTTTGNGLAAPLSWMDNPANNVSNIAYAGDVDGNVWSFALNDTSGASPTPTSKGTLLFTAEDSASNAQPITAGMLAGKNPDTGDVWLFFGTGKYLSDTDITNSDTQTWYGIIVQSSTANIVSNLSKGRTSLVERSITAQTAASGTTLAARSVSAATTNDMNGKSGWYMDLLAPVGPSNAAVQQGERMVDANQFQGSLLLGVTRIPQVSDVCNPSGTGWIMALSPFTGTAPSDDFFDVNGDGFINGSDRVGGNVSAGVGFASLPNAPIFVGSIMETSFDNGSTSTTPTSGTSGTTKRVSWRELVNP